MAKLYPWPVKKREPGVKTKYIDPAQQQLNFVGELPNNSSC